MVEAKPNIEGQHSASIVQVNLLHVACCFMTFWLILVVDVTTEF